MKTTLETIREINDQFLFHSKKVGEAYAVLKPLSDYDEVDFKEISRVFNTARIDSYTMTDKIVIYK